jgi:hypothetical protein
MRKATGRAVAILALAGTALGIGSSLSPDEAEASTGRQGPVACRNNDGTTGVRLGELCVVNNAKYGKGRGAADKALSFLAAGAFGGKCETAFVAGDVGAGFATDHILKVYKAGKFVRYSTVAGAAVSVGGAFIGNKICK